MQPALFAHLAQGQLLFALFDVAFLNHGICFD